MQFEQKERKIFTQKKFKKNELDLVRQFSKAMVKEFGSLIKSIVLFGSQSRHTQGKGSDIDVLVVVDDVSLYMTPELVDAYRIITQKTIASVSPRLHIISLKLTTFWEYIRVGDPIAINILRDGQPIIDPGFIGPLKVLLFQGRIRPTAESIWTYFARAPRTLDNSRFKIIQATLDLYWAVIDSAHAALMKLGEVPPSPDHMYEMLQQKMVKTGYVTEDVAQTMKQFYRLMKMITHREVKDISGKEYEGYYQDAKKFVDTMHHFINRRIKKENSSSRSTARAKK